MTFPDRKHLNDPNQRLGMIRKCAIAFYGREILFITQILIKSRAGNAGCRGRDLFTYNTHNSLFF